MILYQGVRLTLLLGAKSLIDYHLPDYPAAGSQLIRFPTESKAAVLAATPSSAIGSFALFSILIIMVRWIGRLIKRVAISVGLFFVKWGAPILLHSLGLTTAAVALRSVTAFYRSRTGNLVAHKSVEIIKPVAAKVAKAAVQKLERGGSL